MIVLMLIDGLPVESFCRATFSQYFAIRCLFSGVITSIDDCLMIN
ncbi:hypothetical protein SynA1825c_02855 [Synechococcus sp. A18-25c]|nr:hypothetical protein SynA1825c_02855 [Synechococcus sp. A18-25c]